MKRNVEVFDYAGHICKMMKKGILLTTKDGESVNSMTIGWGTLGIEWNKPIFIAYVRESRFTKEMLEKNPEFTVNIPMGESDGRILKFCGTKSGRDTDKLQALVLTLVDSDFVCVPGIQELPLTLECRVLYKQEQNIDVLPESVLKRFYPEEGAEYIRDHHIAYYGEILNAYLIET